MNAAIKPNSLVPTARVSRSPLTSKTIWLKPSISSATRWRYSYYSQDELIGKIDPLNYQITYIHQSGLLTHYYR